MNPHDHDHLKQRISVDLQSMQDNKRDMLIYHRLHVLRMYLEGISASRLQQIFGDNSDAIKRWLEIYTEKGLEGLLQHSRRGRPPLLTEIDKQALLLDLEQSPRQFGFNKDHWDGPSLQTHLDKQYDKHLSLRQCQRWLKELPRD